MKKIAHALAVAGAVSLQPDAGSAQLANNAAVTVTTSPSPREVPVGLDGRRTDVQRDAYWDTVKGRDVRWLLQVSEVTTGWFSGFKVRGKASPSLQVSCELPDTPQVKAVVSQVNKGDRVVCTGKLGSTFVVIFGLATVTVEGVIER